MFNKIIRGFGGSWPSLSALISAGLVAGCSSGSSTNWSGTDSIAGFAFSQTAFAPAANSQSRASSSFLVSLPESSRSESYVSPLCPSGATALLYSINGQGTLSASPLMSAPINLVDGSFELSHLGASGVSLASVSGVGYVLKLIACDGSVSARPVTTYLNQNFDPASSLIGYGVNSAQIGAQLNTVALSGLSSLLSSLEGANAATPETVYQLLSQSPALSAQFQSLFGVPVTSLLNVPPFFTVTAPTGSVNELSSSAFGVVPYHWNPNYVAHFVWKVDAGASVSQTANFSYAPTANSQGGHNITLYVGEDDGSGNLDTTQPYAISNYPLTVNNTYPATAPALSSVVPLGSTTAVAAVTIGVSTGALLANCASFSSLALVESSSSTPPSASSFTINCSASGVQNVPFTLSSGNGVKNLELWAMDSSGNISASPSTLSLTLNTSGPALTLPAPTLISTANHATFSGTCQTGLSVVVSGAESASSNCLAGAWSFTTQNYVANGAYNYTFTETDPVTLNSTSVMGTFTRFLAAESITLSSFNAAAFYVGGSSQSITWSASADANWGSTPISLFYSTNGGTSWIAIASSIANSGSYAWTLPLINSTNALVKITATDLAGNTASAQSAAAFSVDSSVPDLMLTSLNSSGILFAGGTTEPITWRATSAFFGGTPISLDYSSNGGSSWTNIVSNLANSGSYAWAPAGLDGANFKVRVTATDLAGNSTVAVSAYPFAIDSTAPLVSISSPNAGQYVAGNVAGASTTIVWSATDTNFSAAPIKLEYSANGGSTWFTLASATANTGSYAWSTAALATGSNYKVRVSATDLVGHVTQAVSGSFTVTNAIPNLTQTALVTPYVTQAVSYVTFGGACDLGVTMTAGTTITIGGGTDTATAACTGTAPTGSWTYQTQNQTTDGSRTYTFSQTNGGGLTNTVTATWVRDTTPPTVTAVLINNGAPYLNTTMASVQVTASGTRTGTGLQVRIAANTSATPITDAAGDGVNCQTLYANTNWQAQTNATMTYSIQVPDGNGYKKICAWAKDGAGNISTIAGIGNLGVDMGVIQYANSTPPVITAFNAINAATGTTTYSLGDEVQISWTVTDALGLDNNPITLDYTTDGSTWTNIVSGYGGLSANPLTYTYTYTGFNAPSAGFFRVRVRAKNVTGQTSNAVISNVQNTGQWSILAGTNDRGIGGAAQSATLFKNVGLRKNPFAFDPQTGDLYVVDDGHGGIMKIDAVTGIVSQFIAFGTTNLNATTSWAAMPASPKMSTTNGGLAFDSNRYLYLEVGGVSRTASSAGIFQINLSTNQVRLYAGGSGVLGYDASATPTSIYVDATDFTFDESNSMYFFTTCTPGFTQGTQPMHTRIMKLTQNPDGSAGVLSVVAGNCTGGAPASGTLAVNTSVGTTAENLYYSISAWGNGASIYYSDAVTGTYKILNGTTYSTAVPAAGGLIYSSGANQVYIVPTSADSVKAYSVNLSGANGETLASTVVGSGGTSATCNSDGISAASTCSSFYGGLTLNQQGELFFGSGSENAPARVRYVDSGGIIRTYAGTLPFYGGSGINQNLIRGNFSGIYFKQMSEANQGAYPAGLYFMERNGMVIGYIDESTGATTSLFGNQTGLTASVYSTGTLLSTGVTLGGSFSGTLTFDQQGLPWFSYGGRIVSVDVNDEVVSRQTGSTIWNYASGAANPSTTDVSGTVTQPFQVKNQGAFLLGQFYTGTSPYTNANPMLSFLDFSGSTLGSSEIFDVMGGAGSTMSSDTTTPGSLAALEFSSYCYNSASCDIQYVPTSVTGTVNDLLYFSDNKVLRYITDPTIPTSSLLTTAFTAASTIQDFVLSPDLSQAFYLMGGKLYCHTLSGPAKSWCNDASLGPPTGMSAINAIPNQFTWINSSALLISDGNGEIIEYTLLP